MNVLLLHAADFDGEHARVSGRRAQHIRKVLKKSTGDTLRAARAGQGFAEAKIIDSTTDEFVLTLDPIVRAPGPSTHLVLAVPRPKAVSRIISAASSFGVASITLTNAWRVEKSYFDSPRLDPARLNHDAILGCEQGNQCWVPEVNIERSFRRYIEDVDPRVHASSVPRTFLHPEAEKDLAQCWPDGFASRTPIMIALGPEGGFIQSEIASLGEAGYVGARLNTGPLKTEVALAATLGQVALLRRH